MLEHSWCFNPTSPDELLDTFTAKINLHETQILKLLKHYVIAQHCMFERITQEDFIQIFIHRSNIFQRQEIMAHTPRHLKLEKLLLKLKWQVSQLSCQNFLTKLKISIPWVNLFLSINKNQFLSITIEISLYFHLKIFRGQIDKMTRFLFILCYSGAIMTIKTSARNVQIYILYAYKMRLFQ